VRSRPPTWPVPTDYTGIQSVGAGSGRIATEDRRVDVAFEPDTMRVTQRIPEDLSRWPWLACAQGSAIGDIRE
jgi:hypothetical protein